MGCDAPPGRLLHFSTKDVSNLVYGFALLRHRTHLVPALCHADGLDSLSNLLWVAMVWRNFWDDDSKKPEQKF